MSGINLNFDSMELTKFQKLCMAYCKAQEDFGTFQNTCHFISIDLVKELKSYFDIPESQFSLYKINTENEFEIVAPALINALSLKQNSLWNFGIGLTVCTAPETLPQELILIQILIRTNVEGRYFVSHENDATEFEIKKDNAASFHPFFDFLHETIIKTYTEKLQQFIGQNTRTKLGYK
jgi:hypothetical protein